MTSPKPEGEQTLDDSGQPVTKRLLRMSLTRLLLLGQEAKLKQGSIPLARGGAARRSSLVTIRAGEGSAGRAPLVLIHPVGGSIVAYYQLANSLRYDQPVFAFENLPIFDRPAAAPSPEANQSPAPHRVTIEELASRYLAELRAVQTQGRPFFLGGYSMGGLVAFEMARQLRERGQRVAGVIIIDTPTRVREPPDAVTEVITAHELAQISRVIAGRLDRELALAEDDLERLDPAQRLEHVVGVLREQQVVPPHVDAAVLHGVLKVVRANEEAQRRYVPRPYDGNLVVLRAVEASEVLQAETGDLYQDPSFGWQSVCKRPVTVEQIAGEHLRILNPQHLPALGATLQRYLDQHQPERAQVPY